MLRKKVIGYITRQSDASAALLQHETEAEPLYQRALHIWEQQSGPDDPDIRFSLNNLADIYQDQGKYVEAEPLYQRALYIWEQQLGPDHPEVAYPLNGLANLYRKQRKYTQAEAFYTRTLSIREQQLGQQHPLTAETLYDLALLRQEQGNSGEAFSLAERVLQIRSQTLGNAHPKTLATRTLFAHLVQVQANVQRKAASEHCFEAPGLHENGHHENGKSFSPYKAVTLISPEDDLLQGFLEACCELYPHAWCRSSDLWQAYIQWAAQHQERYPLSRGAFIRQLKAHGCRADRTMAARIWCGIALVKKER